jgi:hypothetical protein
VTADEETWNKTGQAAAEHARRTWGWTVVQRDFDHLLFSHEAAGPGEVRG